MEKAAESADGCFGLVEGVVGRADKRAGFDVLEAHSFAKEFELGKFVGVDKTNDGEMLTGGLEILAQGEDVRALRGEIVHGG